MPEVEIFEILPEIYICDLQIFKEQEYEEKKELILFWS